MSKKSFKLPEISFDSTNDINSKNSPCSQPSIYGFIRGPPTFRTISESRPRMRRCISPGFVESVFALTDGREREQTMQ